MQYLVFVVGELNVRLKNIVLIITVHIRRMEEGTVFSLFVSPHLDRGNTPARSGWWGGVPWPGLDGGCGYPGQVWMEGYPGQV